MGDRMFITELAGMDVRTSGGKDLGKLNDAVVDTVSGNIKYLLLRPYTEECGSMKTDPKGRKIVEFGEMDVGGGVITVRSR